MKRTVLLAGVLLLAGCDEWHLSINSDGLVFVSIVDDGHGFRDRFRIRVRDGAGTTQMLNVPTSGELSLPPMRDGELQLTLIAPESCRVAAPNPQTIMVTAGDETRVAFDVHCG
jgi:hypothetical protein